MSKSKKRISSPLVDMSHLDLDNLNLDRAYSIQEFEYISKQLKTRPVEIDGKFIHHFERDKAEKIVPISPTVIYKEAVALKIASQLEDWNVGCKRGGVVTASQGGFKITDNDIRAPDVAFTPKRICRRLSKRQIWTFQGKKFSPTFVVEVDDFDNIQGREGSKFSMADLKFKDVYFAEGSSVEIGLLIDPKHHYIWTYKRNVAGNVFRYKCDWKNVNLDKFLQGFILKVNRLDIEPLEDTSSQLESSEEGTLRIKCGYPGCKRIFPNSYLLIDHHKDDHC